MRGADKVGLGDKVGKLKDSIGQRMEKLFGKAEGPPAPARKEDLFVDRAREKVYRDIADIEERNKRLREEALQSEMSHSERIVHLQERRKQIEQDIFDLKRQFGLQEDAERQKRLKEKETELLENQLDLNRLRTVHRTKEQVDSLRKIGMFITGQDPTVPIQRQQLTALHQIRNELHALRAQSKGPNNMFAH